MLEDLPAGGIAREAFCPLGKSADCACPKAWDRGFSQMATYIILIHMT